MDELTPGDLIAQRYRLERTLGTGGTASVWAAHDGVLGRTVALKLLTAGAAANGAERERSRREARALASLTHPRIVAVYDFLETTDAHGRVQPVLVSELIDGMSLAERLRMGALPVAEALAVCGQVADALAAAHRAGIVHRDVKPGNVMLTGSGAKLLDFGIARGEADEALTGTMVVGTPVCMSPEQWIGRGATSASDVYALGCMLYWSLTGFPPFRDGDLGSLGQEHLRSAPPALQVPGLPPGVAELYQACLAKDPAARPTTEQALAALASVSSGVGLSSGVAAPTRMMAPMAAAAEHPRTRAFTAIDDPHGARPPAQHAGYASPAGAGPESRRNRRLPAFLAVGAVAAVGIAALAVMQLGQHGSNSANTGAGAGATRSATSAGPTGAATTPAASPSASASPSPTGTTLPDPSSDPIGYLQAMSAQVNGFIAQGQDTLDPNAGQDLQNSLNDLEQSVQSAQQDSGSHHWHDVRDKIDGIEQTISDDENGSLISQDAGDQLTQELQDLSDNLSSSSDTSGSSGSGSGSSGGSGLFGN